MIEKRSFDSLGHADHGWLNAKHPARYAKSLADGVLPIASAEQLTPEDRHLEAVMLTTRCRSGLPRDLLDDAETAHAEQLRADGLLTAADDAYVLTDAGRLLADGVIRRADVEAAAAPGAAAAGPMFGLGGEPIEEAVRHLPGGALDQPRAELGELATHLRAGDIGKPGGAALYIG